MAESLDAQTQLKKRARRRLIGAVAFAGLAAVVLPMVMDEEPKQQMQDVQIRIPGQDQLPFTPSVSAEKSTPAPAPSTPVAELQAPLPLPKKLEAPIPRSAEAPAPVPSAKPTEKIVEKKLDKIPEKPAKQSVDDTQRATAILAGNPSEAAVNTGVTYVILLGAFSNAANVKHLQSKISELGLKTYTESLDSPEGKKTRLRAGPFPSREAANKALDRIKLTGIGGVGVVAAKP